MYMESVKERKKDFIALNVLQTIKYIRKIHIPMNENIQETSMHIVRRKIKYVLYSLNKSNSKHGGTRFISHKKLNLVFKKISSNHRNQTQQVRHNVNICTRRTSNKKIPKTKE